MGVTYEVIYQSGRIRRVEGAACFYQDHGKSYADVKEFRYWPEIECDKQEGLRFLEAMKTIGFYIPNPEAIMAKEPYVIPVHMEHFGVSGTSRSWIFAHLSLVRMLHEFPVAIKHFIALEKALPAADKFELLQLSHFIVGGCPNSNHALVEPGWGYVKKIKKFRTWEEVKNSYVKETKDNPGVTCIHSMFTPSLHGAELDYSLKLADAIKSYPEYHAKA